MAYIRGIDVSNAQKTIDWQRVAAGDIRFAFIKASQGHSINGEYYCFTDSYFHRHIFGAHLAGLKCGVYHYLTAKTVEEARTEAAYFIRVIEPYREMIDLYAAVDVEEDRYLPTDRTLLTEIVNAFCDAVEAADFRAAVYANRNYLRNRLDDLRRWPLWLALWRSSENIPTEFENMKVWQYGVGTAEGVEGAVDLDMMEETQMDERDNTPSEWAEEAVAWATENGIMYGDENGDLKLHDPVTREQCIVFLHRLYEKLKEN